jgi:3-hydroxyisobutyrate dehydrogenase
MTATGEIRRVGFIGLGNMGMPMATSLVRAGFDVVGYDLRVSRLEDFVRENKGRVATSLAELGAQADAVITMLPDGKAVREAILAGAAQRLPSGTVVIDMGTSDPVDTRELGRELAARGIHVVDAPVMGGVLFARDATLEVMTGGDPEIVARCAPLFRALGRRTFQCGALGAGHAMKALANYVNACALASLCEALAVGRRFGLDEQVMAQALATMCTGRQHPLEKKVVPQVLTRAFATGMALGLTAKDTRIAADTAAALGVPAPLAERVAEIWGNAARHLGPAADQSEIARLWE